MTVETQDMADEVAKHSATRACQEDAANAERLLLWKARYPFRAVSVPETKEPPTWPAHRSSLSVSATVTRLPTKVRARNDSH